MGITHVDGVVRGPSGQERPIRLLVDSGATYTLLPDEIWRALELAPKRPIDLALAEGTIIRRQVSECHITLPEGEGHTSVILGEVGDAALLGVVTLENLGLVFNPLTRTLQPMRMLMA